MSRGLVFRIVSMGLFQNTILGDLSYRPEQEIAELQEVVRDLDIAVRISRTDMIRRVVVLRAYSHYSK